MLPDHFRAPVGLVLGSGLGGVVDSWDLIAEMPLSEVEGIPASRVSGHAGRFALCKVAGVSVLVMQGRVHLYEGHGPVTVTAGVRAMASAGVHTLVLTNAAGGIADGLAPGRLMRLTDHLNLTGASPLTGAPRFIDMSHAYDVELGAMMDACAHDIGVNLATGVYAGLRGPEYETPAEIRMLATMGADAVGMSTVLETIEARNLDMRVAAISGISNYAAGRSSECLNHEDVLAIGKASEKELGKLLTDFLPKVVG